jgi:cysteine desulfurase/selenocysteine lyase
MMLWKARLKSLKNLARLRRVIGLLKIWREFASMNNQQVAPRTTFDVNAVRSDFPILSREIYGKPLVYLDNAASAQKPRQVTDAIRHSYEHEYANVHRGLHYLSSAATQAYEAAREKTRAFMNARSVDEIIFTSGGTEAINLVASAYGRGELKAGDEIVLTIMEHHSNIVPWHFLRDELGVVIKWAPVSDEGELLIDEFAALLSSRTKIVACAHMSNVLGTFVPLKEMTRLAHEAGAIVVVDGCQAAVHSQVDVQDLDVDFYVVTGHKLYGPTGIGALYGKAELLAKMGPYKGGGEMIHEVTTEGVTYAEPPHRFEAGTPPIVQAIGLGAALDYLDALDRDAVRAHEDDLLKYASGLLAQLNSVRIVGQAPGKGGIISFAVEGAHAHDISTIIDRGGVAVRAGHHCAQPLMNRFDLTSTSRASFALYNTRNEVEMFVASVQEATEFFK